LIQIFYRSVNKVV